MLALPVPTPPVPVRVLLEELPPFAVPVEVVQVVPPRPVAKLPPCAVLKVPPLAVALPPFAVAPDWAALPLLHSQPSQCQSRPQICPPRQAPGPTHSRVSPGSHKLASAHCSPDRVPQPATDQSADHIRSAQYLCEVVTLHHPLEHVESRRGSLPRTLARVKEFVTAEHGGLQRIVQGATGLLAAPMLCAEQEGDAKALGRSLPLVGD
jgi:hypothetical protein